MRNISNGISDKYKIFGMLSLFFDDTSTEHGEQYVFDLSDYNIIDAAVVLMNLFIIKQYLYRLPKK